MCARAGPRVDLRYRPGARPAGIPAEDDPLPRLRRAGPLLVARLRPGTRPAAVRPIRSARPLPRGTRVPGELSGARGGEPRRDAARTSGEPRPGDPHGHANATARR